MRQRLPDRASFGLALLSAILLILAYPKPELAFLAWVALVPLLYVVAFRRPSGFGAFVLGWAAGTVYLIGTCFWISYAMIRYGGIPTALAWALMLPPALGVGLTYGLFTWWLRRLVVRWGTLAIWLAPLMWVTIEWTRFLVLGLLWNSLGYTQAFHPSLIQWARFGGVYAVTAIIVLVNVGFVFWIGRRTWSRAGLMLSGFTVILLTASVLIRTSNSVPSGPPAAEVVAIQPNVPMDPVDSLAEMQGLERTHNSLSEAELAKLTDQNIPRLVIWPESPMSFAYGQDADLRQRLADFTRRNRTSLLINSMEIAPNNGAFNSAMLIDDQGRLVAQYDKIYLLPFGEYMPIPSWVPGVKSIPPIVGNFTRGSKFPLVPVGSAKAGIMICFESAIPSLASHYTADGADAIIEITNDGYLGPTAVQRQHLANSIFRAVENDRPVLRATNVGISAMITAAGEVQQPTAGFERAARTWRLDRATTPPTFYARHGDVFAGLCTLASLMLLLIGFRRRPAAQD